VSLRGVGLAVDLLNLLIIRALGEGAGRALRALVKTLTSLPFSQWAMTSPKGNCQSLCPHRSQNLLTSVRDRAVDT
jgi:hypothetical protein